MSNHSRRQFLKFSGIVSLGFIGLQQYAAHPLLAASGLPSRGNTPGYGPLLPDPEGIIDLPKGFTYKIISRQGNKMNDGFFVPGKADGMATFAGKKGRVIVVRNHEVSPEDLASSPFGDKNGLLSKINRDKVYDYGFGSSPALGGTTTIVYNPQTQRVEQEFLSLAGTTRNCAGGPTPWNSWITCEETVERKGGSREKDHGYCFEVPATQSAKLAEPVPLTEMGRFNHEAVAVDPTTGIVYLTEDRGDGLIYRFLPNQPKQLARGGRLQVLAIRGQQQADTRNWANQQAPVFPVGQAMETEWLDIDNVEAPEDDLRFRGHEKGAARFARGEGMWYGNQEVYFACTNGGRIGQGQVFRYKPSPYEGQAREKEAPGKLELFIEPNDISLVHNCDNLTVAPWGDIVLCEDTNHPSIVGVKPSGEIYKLAKNVGYESEFAGGVFSPDGRTFFVNIQHPGLTLAISGPWNV
jgi:uncharacterized protein